MIQTIHLINVTKKKKKILVTANIEFDTLQTEEDVQNAFEEVLPKALKVTQKKPNQTAANFLQTAMAMVNERYKDIVYLSVNEDRRKGNPKTAINVNYPDLHRSVEVGASCFNDPGYYHTTWQFSQNLYKR